MFHPLAHHLRRRLETRNHARHIGEQGPARAAYDIMHLLDGFADFAHGMQQDRRVFDAAAGLIGKIVQILTHAAQVGDERGQIGIHLRQQLFGFGHGFPKLNQQRDEVTHQRRESQRNHQCGNFNHRHDGLAFLVSLTPRPYRTAGFFARHCVDCSYA